MSPADYGLELAQSTPPITDAQALAFAQILLAGEQAAA